MYPFELEKNSKKYDCPKCGKRTFVRVVENSTGNYLPKYVGRCDREIKCGYQYTWKEFLNDNNENSSNNKADLNNHNFTKINNTGANFKKGISTHTTEQFVLNNPVQAKRVWVKNNIDYIHYKHLTTTLGGYENNSFVNFLTDLFPEDEENIFLAIKEYFIGTYEKWTCFPTIDRQGRFCKAKLMQFNPKTGKRLKGPDGRGVINSLQNLLKKKGKLKSIFEPTKEVYFGDHLTAKYPRWPVALVESEKTAIIASLCKAIFPDVVWLATGSIGTLTCDRLKRIGSNRKFILFPDADGFKLWLNIALTGKKQGLDIKVSELIESKASLKDKADQFDIAEYLVLEQRRINNHNRKINSN